MFQAPPHRRFRIGRLLGAIGGLVLAGLFACDRPASDFELADESAFTGRFGPHVGRAFDVVAADMDVDGDVDVLINWHHLVPMELFENVAGRFELVNTLGRDESGLFDNPGIPSLYAARPEMTVRVEESGSPGLYVWHDLARRGSWRFLWKDDARQYDGFVLDVLTSIEVAEVEGLEASEVEQETPRTLRISVQGNPARRSFALKTVPRASRFRLGLRAMSGEALPLFVGRDLTPHPAGELDVWEPDPHGIAWVDVEGTARPELYITRGGLIGQLVPPLQPKLDRYFLPGPPGGPLYERAGESIVPRDRGRGRRVEWVDVDNDGVLELSIANKATPSRLLVRSPDSGELRDMAAELGLDLEEAEVQCWGDHDGDGFQDLYFLQENAIHVLRNRDGARFERIPGESLGLTLAPASAPSSTLFNFAALRLADFDNDGDLDLWLLGFGEERTNHLFLRAGERFTDVTERVGLASVRGNIFATLLDVDNDGFEDAVSSGLLEGEAKEDVGATKGAGHALLWRNRGGERFDIARLPRAVVPHPIHVATSLDVDGDGRWDLVSAGVERYLLRNTSDRRNSFVEIALRDQYGEPIGALVRVFYSDGSVGARRYGSAQNSAYSQVLGPLHFGVAAGMRVEKIAVRWPGDDEDSLYDAPEPGRTTLIER